MVRLRNPSRASHFKGPDAVVTARERPRRGASACVLLFEDASRFPFLYFQQPPDFVLVKRITAVLISDGAVGVEIHSAVVFPEWTDTSLRKLAFVE
jgi:hypothetical protein